MDSTINDIILDSALILINETRIGAELPEILALSEEHINYAFAVEVTIIEEVIGHKDEDRKDAILTALHKILTAGEDADDQMTMDYRSFLSSAATHISASIIPFGDTITAKFIIIYKYLELDPVGPIIGGDIVLQGSILNPTYKPALCRVEFVSDSEDDFVEVARINPWEMIINSPDNEGDLWTFTIPMSLGTKHRDGSFRYLIYMDETTKIPFTEPDDEYEVNLDHLICAVEYTNRAPSDEYKGDDEEEEMTVNEVEEDINKDNLDIDNNENDNNSVNNPTTKKKMIVAGIKLLATKNGRVKSKVAKNFTSSILIFGRDGVRESKTSVWPYQIFTSLGPSTGDGVEDIIWLRTPKDIGLLPQVPDGYEVYDDADFSADSDEVSACIAVKIGPEPLFTNIIMVTFDTKSRSEAERMIEQYLVQIGGGEYRPAPTEVCNVAGSPAGIILVTGNSLQGAARPSSLHDLKGGSIAGGEPRKSRKGDGQNDDDDNVSRMTFNSSDMGSDDEDGGVGATFADEQEALSVLTKRLADMEAEKERTRLQNVDLQKKVAGLMARLGRDGGTRTVEIGTEIDTAVADNTSEKEKHFLDTLQSIQDGRAKLLRQQQEFDQLALDLQTRLDDKEFKASEISESFKEFKQEILIRSENSRTGKGVSKRIMKSFDQADQKKDEDLEKVRLRHISLRTTLRKLEKNLRAREQLAEGLHMIDFEQLKIENQTLNEKIEERNEELAKLKRKKTVTVQVLTHIREKLRFMDKQNEVLKKELDELDGHVASQRSFLNTYKHDKDSARTDNNELRRRQGFATNEMLTEDYEHRKTSMESIHAAVKELQERHFLLTKQVTMNTAMMNKSVTDSRGEFQFPPINSHSKVLSNSSRR